MKALTGHTPGPWIHNRDGWVAGYTEDGADSWPFVAECIEAADRRATGEMTDREYANADLIAAAPDLLEAVRLAAIFLKNVPDVFEPALTVGRTGIVAVCEHAIASATGGDQ